MIQLNIYTDGAYSSKTQIGGWAMVSVYDTYATDHNPLELNTSYNGWEPNTTNNRMELKAVYEALQFLNTYKHLPLTVTIYTDSAYISNAFRDGWYIKWRQNGWKTSNRTPVLNKDLWEDILSLYEQLPFDIKIEKVQGHSNNIYNILADKLAVEARTKGALEYGNNTCSDTRTNKNT